MTELSPAARRLLGLARRGDDPLETDRVRVNHRMVQRLALAAGCATAAIGTTKAAAGTAVFSTLLGKGILTGVLVTASVFGTWKAAEHVVSYREANRATSTARHQGLPKGVRSIGERRTDHVPQSMPEKSRPSGSETDRLSPTAPVIDAPRHQPSAAEVEQQTSMPTREAATRGPSVIPETPSAATREPSVIPETPSAAARLGFRSPGRTEHPHTEQDDSLSAESTAFQDPEQDDPLSAESAALRAVQYAINRGNAAQALRLLDEQDARYRGGALVPERAAARIVALCKQSRESEARELARRFQQRFANSPLVARVSNACATSLGTAQSSTRISTQ